MPTEKNCWQSIFSPVLKNRSKDKISHSLLCCSVRSCVHVVLLVDCSFTHSFHFTLFPKVLGRSSENLKLILLSPLLYNPNYWAFNGPVNMFLVARSLMAVIFGFCTWSLPSSKPGVTQLSSKCAAYTSFKKDSAEGRLSGFFSKRTGDKSFHSPPTSALNWLLNKNVSLEREEWRGVILCQGFCAVLNVASNLLAEFKES